MSRFTAAFASRKIGTKLLLGFGVVLTFLAVVAVLSLTRMGSIDAAVTHQADVQHNRLDPLYVAREALDQTGLAARNAFIFTDTAEARQELAILDRERSLYLAQLDLLAPRFEGNARFAAVRSDMLAMATALDRPRQYREAGDMTGYGTFLVKECSPLRRKIVGEIGALIKEVQAEQGVANAASAALFQQSKTLIMIVAALCCASVEPDRPRRTGRRRTRAPRRRCQSDPFNPGHARQSGNDRRPGPYRHRCHCRSVERNCRRQH
jgi:methyl-accepting chemotaxis protein